MASVGFSNHSLRNQIMEARDRFIFSPKIFGTSFLKCSFTFRGSSLTLPLAKMIGTLSKPEDR